MSNGDDATDAFRTLSDDEVRQIIQIIESLDRSTLDFLQLQVGDIKLAIGKGAPPPLADAGLARPAAALQPASPQAASTPDAAPAPPARTAGTGAVASPARAGEVDITAPLLGRFYARPEPGAPPFVSVGSLVTADTTVALIEVMKTFNAVPAGTAGIVTEVCVQDEQYVEYAQVLFRVEPHKAV
jgi:acetyl-CoA carboxylase biotin carboxyl carrier protein